MYSLRLLLSVSFVLLASVLIFYHLLSPRYDDSHSSTDRTTGIRSFFAVHAPTALFPPSAIISLTDDNSTFFLSRPADYGPLLPLDGLSGQLWIGSGFGDDMESRAGSGAQAEGELGCTDIPGWSESEATELPSEKESKIKDKAVGKKPSGRGGNPTPKPRERSRAARTRDGPAPNKDDATDDHLHFPLEGKPVTRGLSRGQKDQGDPGSNPEHADIQSLQESAEIAGKVVLLSRGGCGFLEKTKWVQRRGGMGLIVGDNTRGGPLLTMYARGDLSNITIPSLFTSRTTAHLLSSLIPSDKLGKNRAQQKRPTAVEDGKQKKGDTAVTYGSSESSLVASGTSIRTAKDASSSHPVSNPDRGRNSRRNGGWMSSLATSLGLRGTATEYDNKGHSRPPSSGRNTWVASEDWDDEPSSKSSIGATVTKKNSGLTTKAVPGVQKNAHAAASEDFVIGEHDWRDPDMIGHRTRTETETTTIRTSTVSAKSTAASTTGRKKAKDREDEDIATPGSGVYQQFEASAANGKTSKDVSRGTEKPGHPGVSWLSRIFGGDTNTDHPDRSMSTSSISKGEPVEAPFIKAAGFEGFVDAPADHQGLWVTLTPASMSTTPFFDTLLVLVVSPLVTLTVVYALLLLRSRIRRRRWRAPKSVVEQLPVRTYHTMSCSSSSTSSQSTSPHTSSPTSPLLGSNSNTGLTRTRPRSRTTSTISEQVSATGEETTACATTAQREKPKQPKKYKGRQIECVVCLEEYVDGQSRVMSLPCGHEFHAECM
jgi:hypothetical protein